MLRYLPPVSDPRLLVGPDSLDDAAVYRISDDVALVQSVDFITPVVDDPYSFGAIVAANALSDIYAKGATPILALNLVGFPAKTFPLQLLGEILRGGAEKAAEAGVLVAGGHSLDDGEPKYGMAVTGLVHPDRVVTNAGAKAGDILFLTKPLGIGLIATAIDRRLASPETTRRVVAVMSTLNRAASEAMLAVGVNGCTDVTGFGLLGHLHEMALASGLAAEVDLGRVPVLEEAWELARMGVVPEGTHNNRHYLEGKVRWEGIGREEQLVLCDAQTSGGLLIACPVERGEELSLAMERTGVEATPIGRMMQGSPGEILVRRA